MLNSMRLTDIRQFDDENYAINMNKITHKNRKENTHELEHIVHTLPPVVDDKCRVLINGSMLSPKSREYRCYYGHPQNRFWKIIYALWEQEDPKIAPERHAFALTHHIALWNVIKECDIKGASDATICNVVANDMNEILKSSPIVAIFNLGNKAQVLFEKYCMDNLCRDVHVEVLPSTSPANAAWKFDSLFKQYQIIKEFAEGIAG